MPDNAAGWPAGQLFSSATEFGRFCIAFVNGGKLDGTQVLSAAVIEQLSKPHDPIPGSERHYGYGLGVEEENGLRWLSHGGSRTGYGSFVKICPEKKFAVVVLCNKTGERLSRVTDKAIELGLGISPRRRPSRERLSSTEEELRRYAGVYSNGETSVRFAVRDGKLVGPQGVELKKVGENRFVGPAASAGAEPELLFVPGADGRIEFLHRGARALKKLERDPIRN